MNGMHKMPDDSMMKDSRMKAMIKGQKVKKSKKGKKVRY